MEKWCSNACFGNTSILITWWFIKNIRVLSVSWFKWTWSMSLNHLRKNERLFYMVLFSLNNIIICSDWLITTFSYICLFCDGVFFVEFKDKRIDLSRERMISLPVNEEKECYQNMQSNLWGRLSIHEEMSKEKKFKVY